MTTAIAKLVATKAADETLISRYFRKISYSTHAPGTSRRIDNVDAYLENTKLDDERVRPLEVAVIPERLATRIERSRRAINKLFQDYTLPTNRKGTRLVALKRKDDFFAMLQRTVAEFQAAADEAVACWDEIEAFNRDFWRPKFKTEEEYEKAVGSKLPQDSEDFRERFAVKIVDEEPGRELHGVEDEATEQFLKGCIESGKKLQQEMDLALRTGPMEALAQAARKVDKQLEAGERLSPQTFTGLLLAINKLEQCASFTDPEVLNRMRTLQRRVRHVMGEAEVAAETGTSTMTQAIAASRGVLGKLIEDAVTSCDEAIAEQSELVRSEFRPKGFEFLPRTEEDE